MAENAWLEGLRLWLIAHPGWAGVMIFLVAFTESIVVVGILIPGIMILFALGTLIGLGLVDFYLAWVTATLGAILGDSFSYWLGYKYRDRLSGRWPFSRWPELIQQGRDLFHRRGVMGVVIGRFVGPLRPIVPVVAGMLGMSPRLFYPTAIAAGIAWSPAYLLPGVLLGASLDVASAYTLRLGVLLALIALTAWLVIIAVRAVYRSLTRRLPWILKRTVSGLRRHPILARYIGPLVIPARGDVLSIAMLGIVLAASLAVLTGVFLYAVIPGTPDLDASVRQGALLLRNHVADWPLLFSLFLGDWRVLVLSAAVLFGWLLWRRRSLAAWHWLAAVAGAPVLALLTQVLVRQLPAWPQHLHAWGRFPDLPTAFAAAALGFFPVLLARDLRAYQRKWFYLSAGLLIMMAVIARLYFELAAFSAVVNALLLTTVWTAIVGIGFRVRASAWHPTPPLIVLYSTAFAVGLGVLLYTQGPTQLKSLTPLPELQHSNRQHWLNQAWRQLPHSRSLLSSAAGEPLNIQWHGPLDALRHTLEQAGWQWQDHAPTAAQVIHIIHPHPSSEDLPTFLKDHRGRAAAAVAFKSLPADSLLKQASSADTDPVTPNSDVGQRRVVLRLWDSGLRLPDASGQDDQPVWLGEAAVEIVRVHGWWFTTWSSQARPEQMQLALDNVLQTADSWQRQQAQAGLWLLWRGPPHHDATREESTENAE